MPYKLLIWDCDGCLVDSEVIACTIAAEHITKLGYFLSAGSYISRFAGQSVDTALRIIEEETGEDYHSRFSMDGFREEVLRAFREDLQPVEGAREAIGQIRMPQCIASGSSVQRNSFALKLTGLLPYFEDRIYSSQQVAHGKPAPDVFLFASQEMGVSPSDCLVIEDSAPGIQAAKAAGMKVFAFMGGRHVTPAWRARAAHENPDLLFDRLADLPALLSCPNGLC